MTPFDRCERDHIAYTLSYQTDRYETPYLVSMGTWVADRHGYLPKRVVKSGKTACEALECALTARDEIIARETR